jgi:ABC-type protease/lipase transport system fused ATPase/permease subunit
MSQAHAQPIDDEAMTAASGETPARPFGWAWVWSSLWLRKWQLVAVFLLTVAVYAAGLVLPICTQRAVDMIANGTAGRQLVWLGTTAIAAVGIEAALTSLRQSLVMRLISFLNRRISRKAFLHLMRMRIDLGVLPAGDVLNRFQQADKIPQFVLELVPRVVFDTGNAVVSLLLMLYYDAVIGLTMLVAALASGAVLRNRLGQVHALAEGTYKTHGKRQSMLSESVTGIITIKALALEAQRFQRWAAATDTFIAAWRRLFDHMRHFHVSVQLVVHALSLTVLALGCYRILNHQLTFGELLALQMLAGRLIAPVISSGDIWRQYQESRVALTELGRFMAEPQERAATRPPLRRLAVGGIGVANLTLRYAPAARPALDSISFMLPARGRFALVGRNGSGKSSLIRVLLGLQRGYQGEVVIAGHDLRANTIRARCVRTSASSTRTRCCFRAPSARTSPPGLRAPMTPASAARSILPTRSASSRRCGTVSMPNSRRTAATCLADSVNGSPSPAPLSAIHASCSDEDEVQSVGFRAALLVELIMPQHQINLCRRHRFQVVGRLRSAALDRIGDEAHRIVARSVPISHVMRLVQLRLRPRFELGDEFFLRRGVGFALHEEGRAHQSDLAGLQAYLAFEDARRRRIVREQRRGDAGLGILLDEIRRLDCRDRDDDEIRLGSWNAGDGRIPVGVVAILRDVENDLLAGLLHQRDHVLAERETEIVVLDDDRDRFEFEILFKPHRLALLRVAVL